MSLAAGVLLGTACSSKKSATAKPSIAEVGTRAHIYQSLVELTSDACAIVIVRPTGRTITTPFPDGGATTSYLRMSVVRVLSGAVDAKEIAVVDPGPDVHTGKSALLSSSSFLLYLAPAMYDKDRPAGGYAVVGGPAGVYSRDPGSRAGYLKIDNFSADLPSRIDVGISALPQVTKSAKQLLKEGPH